MNFILQPWQLFFAILLGWVNEYSRRRIDYLQTEVEILKEAFGKKRILLTNGATNKSRREAECC